MKKMICRVAAGLLAVVMAFGCTACGSESGSNGETGDAKEGKVIMAFPFGGQGTKIFQQVADAYMEKNPGVVVEVQDKEATSYFDWLSNELASNTLKVDIIQNNQLGEYFNEGKFVDYSDYLNKKNPYADNQRWCDTFIDGAYMIDGNGTVNALNLDQTLILWVYNKRIFKEAGVEPPETWDDMISISKTIKEKTKVDPIGLSGNPDSFWNTQFSWMLRAYADQYWRDLEPTIMSQPGDYNYDEEINGVYTVDYNAPKQDLITNDVRFIKGLKDKTFGPDSDKFRALYANFKKLIPEYCNEDFFGVSTGDCQSKFLKGRVAMTLATSDYVAYYDFLAKNEEERGNKIDEIGYFYCPPMTGPEVVVDKIYPSNSACGWMGVVNKDQKQNDLNMDFMMYLSSKEGQQRKYDLYEENGLVPPGIASMVKGVTLAERWSTLFKDMQKDVILGESKFSRFLTGLENERISVRNMADYSQQFFQGKIDLNTLSLKMDGEVQAAIPRVMEINNWRDDALDDVTKDPAK